MIEVIVDDRLRIAAEGLDPELARAVKAAFTHDNPKHHRLKAMGFHPPKAEPPQIKLWREAAGELSLPRGGIGRLREAFTEHRTPWRTVDRRIEGTGPRGMPAHRVELWEHQKEIIAAAKLKESGIIHSGTGSGKTTAALALAADLQLPTLVIVWSGNLLEQWAERVRRELGFDPGIVRGKSFKISPITLAMQQTLNRGVPEQLRQMPGVVICDEVQKFAAATFQKTIDVFPARYRFGVSDDSRRKDGKAFLIRDLFGPVLHEVERKSIEAAGLVLPVELRIVMTDQTSERYERQREQHRCDHDFGPDMCVRCGLQRGRQAPHPNHTDLIEDLSRNPRRDEITRAIVQAEVAAGHQIVAFSHRVQHCVNLRGQFVQAGHPSGLLVGGEDHADEFARAKRGLIDGTIRAAAGTVQAIGQGLDVPALSRGVLTTPITNNKQLMRQLTGRLCRSAPGKRDAALYVLFDRCWNLAMLRSYMQWYDRVMVHVGGCFVAGEYVDAKRYLKENMAWQM